MGDFIPDWSEIIRHPRRGGGEHYWLRRVYATEQGMDFNVFFEQEAFTF